MFFNYILLAINLSPPAVPAKPVLNFDDRVSKSFSTKNLMEYLKTCTMLFSSKKKSVFVQNE